MPEVSVTLIGVYVFSVHVFPLLSIRVRPMSTLERAVEQMFASRRLTRRDQQMIMAMFTKRDLSPTDADLINRVYEALSQGRLRVVD